MLPLQEVQREREHVTTAPLNMKQPAKNRGRLDVVAEIIGCCERASSKSHIMMVANVNSIVATKMISLLVQRGMVESIHEGNSVHYLATPRGVEFVGKYGELTSMLSPELIPARAGNGNRLDSLIF